jgi:hypothetical protein
MTYEELTQRAVDFHRLVLEEVDAEGEVLGVLMPDNAKHDYPDIRFKRDGDDVESLEGLTPEGRKFIEVNEKFRRR